MRKANAISIFLAAMMAMSIGCMADYGDEDWVDGEMEEDVSAYDDSSNDVEKTFRGDLGVALGTPVVTSSTSGLSNGYKPTCVSNSSASDASYTWTAPSTGSFVFNTAGSGFDTVLELRRYNNGASLGCNDDSSGTLQSSVTVSLSAGETIIVIIDGYSSSTGTFRLNIASTSSLPTSGLHLWLRADSGLTASGGRVSTWLDQSSNGRHAVMNTASRQPYLINSALNGKPVVRFNGAQSMNLQIPAQPNLFTVFIVGKNNKTTESFSMILGPSGSNPNNQLRWDNGTKALFVGTSNNMPVITSTIGNTRVYHALSARYNGSSMSVYRDGNLKSSHSFGTSGPWTLASVGSWYSTYFGIGDLAEIIIYDRALSTSERTTVNTYLKSKYNLP